MTLLTAMKCFYSHLCKTDHKWRCSTVGCCPVVPWTKFKTIFLHHSWQCYHVLVGACFWISIQNAYTAALTSLSQCWMLFLDYLPFIYFFKPQALSWAPNTAGILIISLREFCWGVKCGIRSRVKCQWALSFNLFALLLKLTSRLCIKEPVSFRLCLTSCVFFKGFQVMLFRLGKAWAFLKAQKHRSVLHPCV